MSLFTELFEELQHAEFQVEIEVGSDPLLMNIQRGDDPIWIEELSPSEVSVYSHTSEEQYCAASVEHAFDLLLMV